MTFIEKFLIPLCTTGFVALVLVNPMHFDRKQRISLSIVIVAFAYFLGHSIDIRRPNEVQSTPMPQSPAVIQQKTTGPGSPAIQGVQGDVTVTVDQSPTATSKPNKDQGKAPEKK